jgi:hypothetical protein
VNRDRRPPCHCGRRRALGAALACGGAAALARGPRAVAAASPDPFAFALIGDAPYSTADESRFAALLAHLDVQPLVFVVHVGDFKSGHEPCTDDLYRRRQALLARSRHPLVLLPGDNDWTDCHRRAAGAHDPRERLAALRALLWQDAGALGGSPGALPLRRQPGWPENVAWRVGPVQFVGLHVVGSGNGRDGYPGARAEFEARVRATLDWLADAVTTASRANADALVIALHADLRFGAAPGPGFAGVRRALGEAAARFGGPLLLLHGDRHWFRVDQPVALPDGRPAANLTRVESFGYPLSTSWVRVAYDPRRDERFVITAETLPAASTP